jgi:hypothetical protein
MGLANRRELGLMVFHALTDPSFAGLNVLADSFPVRLAIATFGFTLFHFGFAKGAELAFMGLETFEFLALLLRNGPAEFFDIGFTGAFSSRERGGKRK